MASGSLTKTGYRVFGESASTSGSYRYTGRRIDAETNGLYYYRARMYSPTLGRFLQPDPIGYQGGHNLYAYVGNDPMNNVDPDGLICIPCIGALTNVAIGFGTSLYTGEQYGAREVIRDAVIGAVGGAVGGRLLSNVSRALPAQWKGRIGESVARAGIALRGETVIASQRPAGRVIESLTGRAARAVPDFAVRRANGTIGFVEAKFGTSTLTGAQRALRNQVDDLLRVSRTSYDDVANVGGVLGGAAAGGASALIGSSGEGGSGGNNAYSTGGK